MLKWFIIGTLLYYAILLWRYRDSLGTWFTDRKKQPEQQESKPTVKAGNSDCLVGASRYRMGQMRTNGDILGHLSKGVDNASIFVPQSEETVTKTLDNELADEKKADTPQAIETEFEMEFETEDAEETDISPVTWVTVSRKWRKVSRWGNWVKWYRSFRLSKRLTRKNGKPFRPSAGRKQTSFIRWWNRLTGAGHG